MSIIRKADIRDLRRVNELLEEVLRIHHEGRPDLFRASGKKYSDEELSDLFSNPQTPVFVYENDGKVLGYCFCAIQRQESGCLCPVKTLYIDDLCILPEHRGEHIGSALFSHARTFAREEGCHNITLHVWDCNPSARAFYESLGMKPQYTSMELIID